MSINDNENMDLDSMADDLSGIAPPAPSVPFSNVSKSTTPWMDDTLRSKESALLRLDRLLGAEERDWYYSCHCWLLSYLVPHSHTVAMIQTGGMIL